MFAFTRAKVGLKKDLERNIIVASRKMVRKEQHLGNENISWDRFLPHFLQSSGTFSISRLMLDR